MRLIVDDPVDLATAATDLLLAAVALAGAWAIRHRGGAGGTWRALFGVLALGSTLGAMVHGTRLPSGLGELLWSGVLLCLAATVALFALAAATELWGPGVAGRLRWPLAAIALLFFAWTQLAGGRFLLFVVYELSFMLLVLVGFVWKAVRGAPGAVLEAAAVALTIAAAALQAMHVSLVPTLPLDHNSIFHLVQIAALVVLVLGIRAAEE